MITFLLLILQGVAFLILSFACFSIPGLIILANLKLVFWKKLTLATTFGLCLFSLIGYLSIVLNLYYLPLALVATTTVIFLKRSRLKFPSFSVDLKQLLLIGFFGLGIIGQLLIIAPSGWLINGDLSFWSAHGHDGIWHIELMKILQNGFPLQNLSFASERLVNYHFFSDIAPSFFARFFYLNPFDLYFRFFPLLYSLLLGLSSYILSEKIFGNQKSALWSVFFIYFGGSFGYFITLARDKALGGESIFWSSQIQSSIGNPPEIAVLVIMLTALIFLKDYFKKPTNKLFLVIALLLGVSAVFKIYAFLVFGLGLGLIGFWNLMKKRDWHLSLLTFVSGALALILYSPNSSSSQFSLIFEPWWFIRTMVVATDRLNLLDWELRRQTYLVENNLKRVIHLELSAFLIFLFGNLGMASLGFIKFFSQLKNSIKDSFSALLVLVALISFCLPLLFLQKGVAGNSIQFMHYFLLIFNILAGGSVVLILTKIKFKSLRLLLSFLIILLSIPTQVGLIYQFYKGRPVSVISKEELVAINALATSTTKNDIILVPLARPNTPHPYSFTPIWAWFDTAYVSALSNRQTFLSDNEQMDILGYPLSPREKLIKEIFATEDLEEFNLLFSKSGANYLYFPHQLKPKVSLDQTFTLVYQNQSSQIWKKK